MPIRLRRASVGLLLGLFVLTLTLASVMAVDCEFVLGFKALRDIIGHEIVGECLENEHYSDNGDSTQKTTGGLLVWRKADNHTAFTDGHHTWVNGPIGLQKRLNAERYPWEPDYAPGGGIATQTGAAAPTTPGPIPLPPPATAPTDGTLPLPPAPTHATVTNAPNTTNVSSNLIAVTAQYVWLDGITSFKITSGLAFSQYPDTRDGANVISSGNTIFVCTADQAGKVLEYDVTFSVFGDGIRYQAVWSPEHTIKHSITCSVGPTPTPDPTLPKAPAHTAGITTRAANYEGKLVEVVVAVERVPNVDLGLLISLDDSPAYTLFAVDGTTEYYHAYICTAEDAGQLQNLRVSLSSRGDGVTYRQGFGEHALLQLRLTCPQPGDRHVPGPSPTPTLSPGQETLPVPPQVSASISSRISEQNYNTWRPGSAIVIVEWDYAWPEGVVSIERDSIYHSTYQGTSQFSQSQAQRKAVIACETDDAGKTRTYSVKFRTYGDGVKYRPVWGEWGSPASIIVTCPTRPNSLFTPSVTPTPRPTPEPGGLPLPPAPALSLSSSLRSQTGGHYTMTVTLSVTYEDGVRGALHGGNLFTGDWGSQSSSGTATAHHIGTSARPQKTARFSISR